METPDDFKHQTNTTPFRLHRLYTTALVGLAILLTAGQGVTQWRLGIIQKKIQLIQCASLQRYQSQQLLTKTLQLRNSPSDADVLVHRAELEQLVAGFESSYQQSSQGRIFHNDIQVPNSNIINRLYADIKPYYDTLSRSIRTIGSFRTITALNSPVGNAAFRQLLSSQNLFLKKTDVIVRQYSIEIQNQLALLQWIELAFYVLTIVVVSLVGFGVFRPAIRQLKQTIDQLITAENTTGESNRKLVQLNRSLHEARRRLFQATKQQHQQEINEQKLRASSLIAGQEEERKRLSRELHDGLGQMLTGIKLQIEGLESHLNRSSNFNDSSARKRLTSLKDLITQTISETRSISNDLMPSVLSDFGIISALKMLAESASVNQPKETSFRSNIRFETNLPTGRLDKQVEISLYRITQEAVTNAIRHGNPTQITIDLIERENYLHLVVTDNGKGFQIEHLNQPYGPSQGIHNMRERTKLLNGRFKIRTAPNNGTKLFVSIPYQLHYSTYEHNTINAR